MIVPSKKPSSTKELLSVFLLYLTGLFIVGLSVFALDVKGGFSVGVFNRFVRGENAKENTEYYAYDENSAFSVDDYGDYQNVSIIEHVDSSLPWIPFGICGTRALNGGISNVYQNGDTFYTNLPYFDENTLEWDSSKDSYRILDAKGESEVKELNATEWASSGFRFNENERVTAETARTYPRIYSIEKETCVVMNFAFIVLYILMLPPYLFLVWKSRAW